MGTQTQGFPGWKEVGKNMQRLREDAGYSSAKEFAKAVGMNPATYTSYEQGNRRFNYEHAWIIADALHCPIDALGGRKPPVTYADTNQEKMNRQYEAMNADGKKQAAQAVENAHANLRNRKSEVDTDGAERWTA